MIKIKKDIVSLEVKYEKAKAKCEEVHSHTPHTRSRACLRVSQHSRLSTQ